MEDRKVIGEKINQLGMENFKEKYKFVIENAGFKCLERLIRNESESMDAEQSRNWQENFVKKSKLDQKESKKKNHKNLNLDLETPSQNQATEAHILPTQETAN